MNEVVTSIQILSDFIDKSQPIDRHHVVAHATLSAWTSHWPSQAKDSELNLLEATQEIKKIEHSRWIKQRRIALVKLSKYFNDLITYP